MKIACNEGASKGELVFIRKYYESYGLFMIFIQCFWIAGGLVSYHTMWILTLQLFKNSIKTQEKLRLNLHSSELLEYGQKTTYSQILQPYRYASLETNTAVLPWSSQQNSKHISTVFNWTRALRINMLNNNEPHWFAPCISGRPSFLLWCQIEHT
jgi:hypothetical protein